MGGRWRGVDRLIGAGGWAYFEVPADDRLAAYARAFPFVEVNSTFYAHPDLRTVASWRRRVPASFRFAVRAHRDVSHRFRLRPTPAARASFARTAKIAERLFAVAIVLETPESVRPEPQDVHDLLAAVDLPCPVALEARAFWNRPLPSPLAVVMESDDIADAVDFSRQRPRTASTLAYGRLFGAGDGNRWEFSADELAAIKERGEATGAKRVAYTFHGVRMYKDAGRFLTFVRTGKAPPSTRHRGVKSLQEILEADARFPATKADLVREHGFRVVDTENGRDAHAVALLARLPLRRFVSAAEVAASLVLRAGNVAV